MGFFFNLNNRCLCCWDWDWIAEFIVFLILKNDCHYKMNFAVRKQILYICSENISFFFLCRNVWFSEYMGMGHFPHELIKLKNQVPPTFISRMPFQGQSGLNIIVGKYVRVLPSYISDLLWTFFLMEYRALLFPVSGIA